ncbi:hypothetical protein DH2020_024730 [Rehmannia glutinosa]|uniref:Uncharacterized protein n=1 Tax=Rehmannia glutinosa TaxID=99300 RepID=A0ABR0W5Q4_REHGL
MGTNQMTTPPRNFQNFFSLTQKHAVALVVRVVANNCCRELKKHAQPRGSIESLTQYSSVRFRPYVSRFRGIQAQEVFCLNCFRYGHCVGLIGQVGKTEAELLKADMAFLECLERPNMSTKEILRQNLVRLQSGKISVPSVWLSNIKLRGWNFAKTRNPV